MFTRDLMKRIHEIARGLEGHYHARLSLAFAIIKKGDVEVMTIEEKIQEIIKEYDFSEKFSKTSYNKKASIWEKYGKRRLYVPRNAYEQLGYIDLDTMEIVATRPGNYGELQSIVERINK